MSMSKPAEATAHHDIQGETAARTTFGFWTYLMTDCVLFASLFVTYAVLHKNTFGGPGPEELFSLPFVLVETLLLLTSSFTSGLAMLALRQQATRAVLILLGITFVLGAAFLGMELYEFNKLVNEGNSWERSGFLSAFFTLVGTHGAHITAGLVWIAVMALQLAKRGITPHTSRRLTLFSLFWHFLDIVWIFIFTLVYLLGAL
jgi:cytochrome o ubiquinol oxidase subunit 3